MTHTNDIKSLLSQLEELDRSKDYLTIGNTLDRFDSKITDIIQKWISNSRLSNEEINVINLYSKLQLCFVEYFFFESQSTVDNETIIELFRKCLFRTKQINDLKRAVIFIRDEQPSNDNKTEQDEMLIYLIRMLDARSLAYRLCFKDLNPPPRDLNNELNLCLTHDHAKNYFYDMKSNNDTGKNFNISYRHQFFVGCCTFAIALFEENKRIFQNDDKTKYICLLAKYVRIVLSKIKFEENKSFVYCLRGILALLTNCVPTNKWTPIINRALANPNDEDAQEANPFNRELFSFIIVRLLGSETLRNKAIQSDSNDITSLVDVALIFLNKWCDTTEDLTNDSDYTIINDSSSSDEQNQVLRLLRSNELLNHDLHASQIIIPYIDAKYDRVRLMAVSTLSRTMNFKDFQNLQQKKPNMAQDIVKLIFYFIDRAVIAQNYQYKGISFELLLRYLLRFLVQDVIKEETIPYIANLVIFAEQRHLNALKILRRISSSTKLTQKLIENLPFDKFLKTTADALFDNDPTMKRITEEIRRNLAPERSKELPISSDDGSRQAFISYCHRDKSQRIAFVKHLDKAGIFTNIWVDEQYMKDNIVNTITTAIRQSKAVFVLLSEAYCSSDMCRREWEFALKKNIKVYPIIVQEGFKTDMYDWVAFNIGQTLYYRIHGHDALKRLMENLKKDLHERKNSPKILTEPPLEATANNQSDTTREQFKDKAVAKWTPSDIHNWCEKNNLRKWCEPLAEYHGEALLELNRLLETDANLPHIAHGHGITLIDVVLFKCELQKLLSNRKARVKTAKKKDTVKHRTTNMSTK
ncbi:unnamed protein product [Rotaria magnacalcarata]|nr:unnamed protein product [Rotaria magnacalcarata]